MPLSLPQPLAALRRPSPGVATAGTRHVSSQSLLAGARELVIQHQGGEYHLRLTRNDKLILTK
ncbi:hemin transporter [Rhodanobacter sp. C03]|nr:hemin transporter [Rhodanobacter sp. C03]